MKSSLYSVALIGCLSVATVFAQGRSGGRGPIEIPDRAEQGSNHSAPTDTERGKGSNSTTTHATTRSGAQGPKDPSTQINDGLAKTLKGFFPEGTDLGLMAAGFKNLGQFVAAVHVSANLDIPFDTLKMKMVDGKMSLGAAIKSWNDEMSSTQVNAEVKKAEDQAKEDLKTTS